MAGNQQFCLRWNNHQSTLISVFDNLLESGTLVDCTLAAEGQYLKAHKVVLSACSPFFEGVFSQHYEKHPIIILKDVTFTELKAMLDYMYRGEVNISQEQLGTFLKAAESLQIKGLTDSGNGEIKRERKIPPLFPQGLIVEQRAPKVNNNDSPPPPLSLSPKRRKRKSSEEKEEMIIAEQSSPALPLGSDGIVKTEIKGGSESGGEQFDFEDEEEMDLSKPGTSANSHPPGGWNASTESQSDDAFTLPGGSQEQGTVTKYGTPMSLVTWDLWASMQPSILKGSLNATGKLDTKRPEVLTWCEKSGGVDLNQSNTSAVGYYGNDGVECTKCGRHYKLKSSLRNHQKWECGKEPQFKCPYCNYRAKQKMHVARHIERMHREKLDMLELHEQALKKGNEIHP